MQKRYLVSFLLCASLAGCGGSSSDFQAVSGASASSQSVVVGKFAPGLDIAGAPVELQTLDGTVLAQATTDETGNFSFPAADIPQQLTVTARLSEGSQFKFESRLVRGADQVSFVVVSIPTTLIARYLERHPEVTLEQAEEDFSNLVGAAPGTRWSLFLDESHRYDFAHLAFYHAAQNYGGVEGLVEELLRRAASEAVLQVQPVAAQEVEEEEEASPEFALALEDLDFDGASLEPEFAQLARNLTARSPQLQKALFADIGIALGKKLLGKIGSAAVSKLGSGVFSWIVASLGLNGPSLSDIQNQLNEIQRSLAEIRIDFLRARYQDAVTQLNTNAVNPITILNSQISSLVASTPVTNEPFVASPQVQQLPQALSQFVTSQALLTLQNYMLGTNGQLNLLEKNVELVNLAANAQPAPRFMNMPLRSNRLLDQALEPFSLYAGYQVMACHLLVENAHQIDNPVDTMNAVRTPFNDALISLKRQRGQIPQPLVSDKIFVDLQFGLMWYLDVQAPRSLEDAKNFARGFSVSGPEVTYDDWRLPLESELKALQARGRFSPSYDPNVPKNTDKGYGDWGSAGSGLSYYGFSNPHLMNKHGELWSGEPEYYIPAFGNEWRPRDFAFRLNHRSSNHSQPQTAPFVMVRPIGRNLHKTLSSDPGIRTSSPFTVAPAKPLVPAEASALGVPVEMNGLSVVYRVYTGGSFICGDPAQQTTETFNLPSEEQSLTLQTFEELPRIRRPEPGQPERPPIPGFFLTSLGDILAFSTNNPGVEVTNLPDRTGQYLWHTDLYENLDVTVSASIQGYRDGRFPVWLTGQTQVNRRSSPRYLTDVQIFPRNRTHERSDSVQYTAVGYYSDGTAKNLTSEVEWALVDTGTGQPEATARFSSNTPGRLQVENTTTGDLTLRVTVPATDFNDSTRARVVQ